MNRKKTAPKKSAALQSKINKYLENNPAIEESLKIFNMSAENYQNAINAITPQKIKISTTTTNIHNG